VPQQLTTTLVDMIEHGTGGAAYCADVMEAVVALAVDPPAGPPASAAGFLARLDTGWLAAAYAGSPDGQHADLLAVGEFSAVSRRLPIWQLYERARSLGLALQVSAQSWPGLAPRDDDRYRIAATADGGIWLLRTPHPEPATELAGRFPATDTSRRVLRAALWGHQGSSRVRNTPVADPAIIRSLDTGQAAYIYRGGVTFIQIKRLVAAPAALAREPASAAEPTPGPGPVAAAHPGAAADQQPPAAPPPDASPLLDEAFGKEPD
jgi:hypothetical protein